MTKILTIISRKATMRRLSDKESMYNTQVFAIHQRFPIINSTKLFLFFNNIIYEMKRFSPFIGLEVNRVHYWTTQ